MIFSSTKALSQKHILSKTLCLMTARTMNFLHSYGLKNFMTISRSSLHSPMRPISHNALSSRLDLNLTVASPRNRSLTYLCLEPCSRWDRQRTHLVSSTTVSESWILRTADSQPRCNALSNICSRKGGIYLSPNSASWCHSFIERLIGLIRFIVEVKNERFIIVSDRLFLLTFALYVLFPEEAELMTGMSIDEVKGWNPGGGENLGDHLNRQTTSGYRRWRKLGGTSWTRDD